MSSPARLPERTEDQRPPAGSPGEPAPREPGWTRDLFPLAEERAEPRSGRRRAASAAAQAGAVGIGVILLLGRVSGTPAWDGIYAEDLHIFLRNALQHPWHLLIQYAGYMQLLTQSLGQIASLLPLRDAAAFFAVAGALIASGCALFVFHASAGHIRSPLLRGVLSLAVVLMPVAAMEIVDSGTNSSWYLMIAMFWAILWRPRTRGGAALAAALAFLTVASNALAIVFAPLLLLRIIALPRWREHAVTAGFALGALAQMPYVLGLVPGTGARVSAHKMAQPLQAAAFYVQRVILPSLGWHLSWSLRDALGTDWAAILVGCLLAVMFGWALVTLPRQARVFVLAALIAGFVFAMAAATVNGGAASRAPMIGFEAGSRYTDLPILLLQTAAIVAVDWRTREWRAPDRRFDPRSIAAIAALVAVLAGGWISDYRYNGMRSGAMTWPAVAREWLNACRDHPAGAIYVSMRPDNSAKAWIPCAHLRR